VTSEKREEVATQLERIAADLLELARMLRERQLTEMDLADWATDEQIRWLIENVRIPTEDFPTDEDIGRLLEALQE
jgi:hypothetical protein